MRLVFMGTPAFAVPTLRALHEAGHGIVAVYTQPPRPAGRGQKETPSPVHDYALKHGLPVFTPTSLKSPDIQSQFAAHKADAAIVAAYGLLLPKPILDAYPLGCINVHPSLLPRWRGAAPIERAVMAGDTITGITIMQMDEGLDTGDILMVKEIPLEEYFDAGTLRGILANTAGPMVLHTLAELRNGTVIRRKQPAQGVTYAKKITKDECRIDWHQPAGVIYNQIRGLSPSPGAYFIYQDERIKILDAEYAKSDWPPPWTPGEVADERFATILCGSGALIPCKVQRAGKKPMKTEEMLRGFSIPRGTILE